MHEQEAVRRLVKSGPELWSQCSDPQLLGRHLTRFGEITITRLEPESTVAWEGESVSGTVTLEASGWGTKVRLTALTPAPEPVPDPLVILSPPARSRTGGLSGLIRSILARRAGAAASGGASVAARADAAVAADTPVAPAAKAVSAPRDLIAELEAALDSLGQAHHRPYSRS